MHCERRTLWIMTTLSAILVHTAGAPCYGGDSARTSQRLAAWSRDVSISPVLPGDTAAHSVHTYQNVSPESPDGRYVLFYSSTTPEGHTGRVQIVERGTGQLTTLADHVTTEDIHRSAGQQWVGAGKTVVYQDLRDGEWLVAAVDLTGDAKGEERILAHGRQLGIAPSDAEWAPLHGPPWAPGEHTGIDLVNVRTGETKTAISFEQWTKGHEAILEIWQERLPDAARSLYFGILSPDRKRIIFKMSNVRTGQFQHHKGSSRAGMFCYDLATGECIYHSKWAHPDWAEDSKHIVRSFSGTLVTVNVEDGRESIERKEQLPSFSSHPVYAPDGVLFSTDLRGKQFGLPGGLQGFATYRGCRVTRTFHESQRRGCHSVQSAL